jgi:hypothetical protein
MGVRHPQFVFQFFDLPAQSRLTDEASCCRFTEVMGFGNGDNVLQIAKIHFRM